MIRIKLPSKKVLAGALVLVILAGLGWGAYSGRNRFDRLETRVNDLEAYNSSMESEASESEVEYTLLEQSVKRLRVEDGYDDNGDATYTTKDVLVVKMHLKNNSESIYDYEAYNMAGKTEDGVLIDAAYLHPDDEPGLSSVSLAQGGKADVYTYIATDGQKIVSVVETYGSTTLDL